MKRIKQDTDLANMGGCEPTASGSEVQEQVSDKLDMGAR
jgi:hypothetical protein